MLVDLSTNQPRVIAMIDLPDLRWQLKRIGGAFEPDLTPVLGQLEDDLAGLYPESLEVRLPLGAVYLYSPAGADRSRAFERGVLREPGIGVKRECQACGKACTHCQGGATDQGGLGRDNPIADDLLELAREDEYDWAVVISTDLLLIPVVRYLQSGGRKIIHGCFPPVAMDLTKNCWASIDLRLLNLGLG
jgi:hypothetical protein